LTAELGKTEMLLDSLRGLNPLSLLSNPVMLTVEIAFFLVLAVALYPQAFGKLASPDGRAFYVSVAALLLLTVWLASLTEVMAERQAKMSARSLRKMEAEVTCCKLVTVGWERVSTLVKSSELRKGDVLLVKAGEMVPIDGEVIEGIATVDEALVSGESRPVRKAPGDILIGGSSVTSDSLTIRVAANPGETFVDRMIQLVETSKRPKTPNEKALSVVLLGFTAIFSIVIASLLGLGLALGLSLDIGVLLALYVCLLPTTIGALLPAIGISGIARLQKSRVLAKSGRAIETAGDTDVILLDKTGTITVGNRRAVEFVPFTGYAERDVGEAAFLSSWHDDTPEGRSIITLAYERGFVPRELNALALAESSAFSAATRLSRVKLVPSKGFLVKGGLGINQRERHRRKSFDAAGEIEEFEILKGAPDAVKPLAKKLPAEFDTIVDVISASGDTAMIIMKNGMPLGAVRLKDELRRGIIEKIVSLKEMGIRPVMLTGDQSLTAGRIANEAGIEEYIARARPEDKFRVVQSEQSQSKIVAMIGDGTNDAPALALSDIGLAMNSGTQAAKEAANFVDLDSDPAKIIDIVVLGKQLLTTRGAVTTFSLANDVAKYFAILPVLFAASEPALRSLNILGLSLHTAVLSALLFNALIIPILVPLALRGVPFRPSSTMSLFLRNFAIYGLGGLVVPFVGIKLIDIVLSTLAGWVA
jgi:K+-transporting ATPase ATPase B chain